jgi:hypothetical protein
MWVVVIAITLGWAGLAAAQVSPCPSNFVGYQSLSIGKSISCACSAEQLSGSVWGTDRYTGDSSICAAALHAGVIAAKGGTVKVFREGSCPKLVGSTRHGVTSRDWGPYESTFAFKHPAPACAPEPKSGDIQACPATMRGYETRATTQALECACAPVQLSGSVWGSDIYTFDSSVCQAARHAGVVTEHGGQVTVFVAGRCASFDGTTRNGVTTSKWGLFDNTFTFRFPLPACADGSLPPKK